MPFRYEIWEYTDSGLLNDQLHISSYSKLYDVTPNDNGFGLAVEKYDDQEFYRVKPSGSLKFTGDDWSIIQDITEDCTPYLLVVFDTSIRDRSAFIKNNFWDVADYIGFVKKRSTTFDYDRCEATVEPETFDIYTQFLKTYDNEYNLFEYASRAWVQVEDGTDEFEYPVESFEFSKLAVPTSEITDFSDYDIIDEDTNEYWEDFKRGLLYKCEQRYQIITASNGANVGFYWNYYFIYKREFTFTNSSTIPPDEISTWEYDGVYPNGLHKWVRTPLNIATPTYEKIVEDIYPDGSKYILNTLSNYIDFEPRQRGITLFSALEGLRRASEYATATPNLETFKVSSSFLRSSNDPITGTANKYKNLILLQASDAKPTSDPATVMNTSLKSILDALRLLNLRWFLEYDPYSPIGRPRLIIEHMKYFNNGYSYGSLSSDYTVDNSRLIIGFTSDNTPQKEKMTTSFAISRDFVGKPIEYPVGCAGDDEVQHQFDISTDLLQYIINPEDTPNDIILLLATEDVSYTTIVNEVPYTVDSYRVMANTGALSGFNILNTDLSVANLQETLWTYDRYAPTGTVNGSELTFDSIKRMRQQQKVSVTIPYKQIMPYKGVTTGYGLGKISNATYNIRNCKWDTTITYE